MDPQMGCKKSLTPPYQQSFRIDDLLTRKAIEQQPDHFAHQHTPLQPPPSGPGMGGARFDKSSSSATDFHVNAIGNGMVCHDNGKSGPPDGSNNNCESESKTPTKRSYSSTSNEDEDELYRKRKKARTAFSREQVADLEKKFQEKKYLSSAERGELAEKLKLSDMQVKTWFQNRRMKFKRQSEEAEMEMKSPKYPYGSFMPYGGMGSFYSYVPMYKSPHEGAGVPYTYNTTTPSAALRSPQTTSPLATAGSGGGGAVGGMDNFVMNSPTMLGSLSSPLSAGMSPRLSGISASGIPRANPTSSYFNGILTPISPSTGYQHNYFNNDAATGANTGSLSNHAHLQSFSEWPRAIPAPTTP